MTNEQKAAVERAAKNLIKGLKTKVSHCDSDDNDVSWGMQEGILISKGDAKAIIELMESHTAALLERVKELEGLFTPDQMRGQRKHNHVETWYESHIQKEKYREALERILQGNCSPIMVAKEALKQQ